MDKAPLNNALHPHTVKNRIAGMSLASVAASKGDPICGAAAELLHIASESGFYMNDLYADEEDDWADMRPY